MTYRFNNETEIVDVCKYRDLYVYSCDIFPVF